VSVPVSPVPWTLVDFAPSEFAQLVDDGSPVNASAGALTNELGMAAQAVSGETTNPLSELLNGVSPPPSTPGDFVGFSGEPSLLERLLVSVLDFAEPFEKLLGINFESTLTPLIESASPPALLTALDGLTVTQTTFDGMPVYDLTPADPSGQYVIALHGGGYVDQPTTEHWSAYTDMAHQTGATVVVPIYELANQGGTAGTVEPEIAGLISSEIAAQGADHVSLYGDSAGGGMALSAVELLVSEGKPVPESIVLDSPTLDLTMSNPDISLINDPILGAAGSGQQDALLWAGDLSLTNPLVSPLYGSLEGLPPTYVYSGSDELLAPDVLVLEKDAIAQDAPFSFILRTGEIHDWALTTVLDGAQVQSQIYQELGLTGAGSSAATNGSDILADLRDGLQNLAAEFTTVSASGGSSLGDLSTDVANMLSTVTTEATALWSTMVGDALTSF
jgi:triacylglycerol lipase